MPAPVLYTPAAAGPGLSGCHCGGACDTCKSGLGGLFDSGLDLSQWGVGEWIAAAGVTFLGFKLLSATMQTTRTVKRAVRKRGQTSERRRQLLRELEDLR